MNLRNTTLFTIAILMLEGCHDDCREIPAPAPIPDTNPVQTTTEISPTKYAPVSVISSFKTPEPIEPGKVDASIKKMKAWLLSKYDPETRTFAGTVGDETTEATLVAALCYGPGPVMPTEPCIQALLERINAKFDSLKTPLPSNRKDSKLHWWLVESRQNAKVTAPPNFNPSAKPLGLTNNEYAEFFEFGAVRFNERARQISGLENALEWIRLDPEFFRLQMRLLKFQETAARVVMNHQLENGSISDDVRVTALTCYFLSLCQEVLTDANHPAVQTTKTGEPANKKD